MFQVIQLEIFDFNLTWCLEGIRNKNFVCLTNHRPVKRDQLRTLQEHITTVYKQFIRPILTYAHTAWQPLLKDTNLKKLQVTQNAALRTATGCTKTTPNDHVHQETKVLSLQDHMDMIAWCCFGAACSRA